MFGPISGAHFNPVVSLVDAALGGLRRRDLLIYVPAQVAGCIAGAVVANATFGPSAVSISTTHRASSPHLFAEVVATVGLLLVIFSLARSHRGQVAPAAVGAYIGVQVLGGAVALGLIAVLYPDITSEEAGEIMVPQEV